MASPGGGQATVELARAVTPVAADGEARFDELYALHARRVRALIRRRLADPQQVEDAVQETFLHVFRSLHTLDPGRPAWPWIARIATNVCMDTLRRFQTHPEHSCIDLTDMGDALVDRSADPTELYAATENRRAIGAALREVCSRQRRVLLLREAEGWRYDDIAALEGMSLDALKGTLKRARQNFREAYAAIVEAGGALGLALSPRRAWRWLRGRIREAVDRVQQAAGSLAGWASIPFNQLSGFLVGATVALASVSAFGGTWMAPLQTARSLPASLMTNHGLTSRTLATPNSSNRSGVRHGVAVSAAVPAVGALPAIRATATATRPRDPDYSRGIALLTVDAPVIGHLPQGFSYLVHCTHSPAHQAACNALDAVPGPG